MSVARLPLSLLVPSVLLLAACGGAAGPTGTATEDLQCSIPASCTAVDTECLGAVDNAGRTRFGLRISQLDVTRPRELTAGILGRVVADDVLPADVACNLPGRGTFSWLLRFDTALGTLESGGARPVADLAQGYRFADETLLGWSLQPATFALDLGADGSFTTPVAQDLAVPVYLDSGATQAIVLPLRGARFTAGVLSSSRSCIGTYDLAALDTANDCLPADGSAAFRTGGTIAGAIRLEDANRVTLPAFAETLCARLGGDAAAYVEPDAAGIVGCRRDATGRILFQGDACSTPGGTCTDAIAVAADFAASSVLIDE